MTLLACWIVGAALAYWLAERELPAKCRPGLRRKIAAIVIVAWPCALAIYVLSLLGIIGDDDEGGA